MTDEGSPSKPLIYSELPSIAQAMVAAQLKRNQIEGGFDPVTANTIVRDYLLPWSDNKTAEAMSEPTRTVELMHGMALGLVESGIENPTRAQVCARMLSDASEVCFNQAIEAEDEPNTIIWSDFAWGMFFVAGTVGFNDLPVTPDDLRYKHRALLEEDPDGFSTIRSLIEDTQFQSLMQDFVDENWTENAQPEFILAGMEAARRLYTQLYRSV